MRVTADRRGLRLGATGIGVIAMGIALMTYDSLAVASARQFMGDGFLLLASLCWSSYGVYPSMVSVAGVGVVTLGMVVAVRPLKRAYATPATSIGFTREGLLPPPGAPGSG